MSECEQCAQVTQDKWVNERVAQFFEQIKITHFLFRSQKIVFFDIFYSLKKTKDLLVPSERIAHVAQEEWAIVSKSLKSFTKNEQMSE